jgi:hypothetical protein
MFFECSGHVLTMLQSKKMDPFAACAWNPCNLQQHRMDDACNLFKEVLQNLLYNTSWKILLNVLHLCGILHLCSTHFSLLTPPLANSLLVIHAANFIF